MRYRNNQELEIIFRKYITNISTLQYNYANIVNSILIQSNIFHKLH